MEVGLDRLPGGDVVILLQHHAARADGGLEQRRRGGLPPEKGDDALRDGALALPVAPAGGCLLYTSPVDFQEEKLDPNMDFYILGLSPNAARLSVRFFLHNTFQGLSLIHISQQWRSFHLLVQAVSLIEDVILSSSLGRLDF